MCTTSRDIIRYLSAVASEDPVYTTAWMTDLFKRSDAFYTRLRGTSARVYGTVYCPNVLHIGCEVYMK